MSNVRVLPNEGHTAGSPVVMSRAGYDFAKAFDRAIAEADREVRTGDPRLRNILVGSNVYRFHVTNRASSGPTRMHLYSEISDGEEPGVDASAFIRELHDISGPIDLHVSSPGGSVFPSFEIYGALRQRGDVTAYVDQVAASAASFICCGADQTFMAPNAKLMVHDCMGGVTGNAAEVSRLLETLNSTSDLIAAVYSAKSGHPVEHWRNTMRREAWFSAPQAVAAGLADGISR